MITLPTAGGWKVPCCLRVLPIEAYFSDEDMELFGGLGETQSKCRPSPVVRESNGTLITMRCCRCPVPCWMASADVPRASKASLSYICLKYWQEQNMPAGHNHRYGYLPQERCVRRPGNGESSPFQKSVGQVGHTAWSIPRDVFLVPSYGLSFQHGLCRYLGTYLTPHARIGHTWR